MSRSLRRAISALVLASSLGLVPQVHADEALRTTKVAPMGVTTAQSARDQILADINRERAAVGVAPLTLRPVLQTVAQGKVSTAGEN